MNKKIKNELFRFKETINETSKVYDYITNGIMNESVYWSHDVIKVADEIKIKQRSEYIEEGLQEMINEEEIDFETAVKIKEYLI